MRCQGLSLADAPQVVHASSLFEPWGQVRVHRLPHASPRRKPCSQRGNMKGKRQAEGTAQQSQSSKQSMEGRHEPIASCFCLHCQKGIGLVVLPCTPRLQDLSSLLRQQACDSWHEESALHSSLASCQGRLRLIGEDPTDLTVQTLRHAQATLS